MPRSIWRGAISFGLVSVPVKLFTATQSKNVSFRQLHAEDRVRLKQLRWCPEHDREIPQDEVARGYEFAKDQYVVLDEEDFENLPVPSQHTVDLTGFVRRDEIDPAFFDRTYYLEPDQTAVKPFSLLVRALNEKGLVGVGKLALRNRESVCALRASGDRLLLTTLFFADEIKIDPEVSLDGVQVADAELEIAYKLIDMLTGPFNPQQYTDAYREALLERISAKIEGRETVEAKQVAPAQTVDLIAALKASIEAAESKAAGGEATEAAAGKPRASKKPASGRKKKAAAK